MLWDGWQGCATGCGCRGGRDEDNDGEFDDSGGDGGGVLTTEECKLFLDKVGVLVNGPFEMGDDGVKKSD